MDPRVYAVDLADKRRELGMTQIELGERLGVTNTTISCIENAKMGLSLKLALACVDIFGQLRVRRGDQVYRLTRQGLIPLDQRSPKPDTNQPDELDDSGFTAESALAQLRQEHKEAVAYHDKLFKDVADGLAAGRPTEELAYLVKEAIADPYYRAELASRCIARIDPAICYEGFRLSREEFTRRGLLKHRDSGRFVPFARSLPV
jgi:DNA-binding XRE family transcriptional regulator